MPLLLVAASLASCSVDKYLQPGQTVLKRNTLHVTMADSTAVPPEVEQALLDASRYYYQTPNKKILWVPWKMRLYCLTNPRRDNWLNNFVRDQGEPPVVYDRSAAVRTAAQLEKLMKTKGCFNSKVTTDTTHLSPSSVAVNYRISATHRRRIDELRFSCRQQHDIDSLLQRWKGESLLKVGDYYDQDKMTAEQARITTHLKNSGYYYASNDLVRFYVDTSYDSLTLSILVVVRQPGSREAGFTPLRKYRIDNIYIYPNISTALSGQQQTFDTLVYPYITKRGSNNYQYIYNTRISPSPRTISRSLFIFNRMTYSPRIVASTTSALLGLHNFKYVDIGFEESPNSTDATPLLDARIRLLNSTRRKLSLSFELTNSTNFNSGSNYFTSGNLGLGTTVGYQNCNLFGGAEMLNVEGNLIFDLPKNIFSTRQHDFHNTFSSFEFDYSMSLDLPSFLIPFGESIIWQTSKPHTLFEISSNYLFRNLSLPDTAGYRDITLERFRIGGSFGYTWFQGRNVKHKLLPFNLSYSHLISGADYYTHLSALTSDRQFIFQAFDYVLLNTHYEYTLSDQHIGSRDNFNYLRFSVETAGNLLTGLNNLFSRADGTQNRENVIYYQYFRFDSEYKRYIYVGKKSTLVLRALAGIGLPYGHSQFIPYEKMFVGGGPTTMRGWQLRRLGYGQFQSSTSKIAMGTGDIQLVANIEHRFPLLGIFEGALFADAGNVWMCPDWGINTVQPFQLNEIVRGIALDAGIGIRANISIVTLRADIALPLYDPGYQAGQRWIGSHWAWDKVVTNFGINYPF